MNGVQQVAQIEPNQYFESLKSKKNTTTDADLDKFYENCIYLINKYRITNQIEAIKKLIFQVEVVERERKLVQLGIDTFVYKDDIEEYIDDIAKNVVKIIDLESYERDIPAEIVDIVAKTRDIFDKFYVVFTDYTGKVERKVNERRREKDPILFGTFQNPSDRIICDRFYFLGDWVDAYCDLTLDKMVSQYRESKDITISNKVTTPTDLSELRKSIDALTKSKSDSFRVDPRKRDRSPFFAKVRSFISRKIEK